jgi:hypothetical protein
MEAVGGRLTNVLYVAQDTKVAGDLLKSALFVAQVTEEVNDPLKNVLFVAQDTTVAEDPWMSELFRSNDSGVEHDRCFVPSSPFSASRFVEQCLHRFVFPYFTFLGFTYRFTASSVEVEVFLCTSFLIQYSEDYGVAQIHPGGGKFCRGFDVKGEKRFPDTLQP